MQAGHTVIWFNPLLFIRSGAFRLLISRLECCNELSRLGIKSQTMLPALARLTLMAL